MIGLILLISLISPLVVGHNETSAQYVNDQERVEGKCRCFGRHSLLCIGALSEEESCLETRHLLLLSGASQSFPSNWKILLPNLQRIDVEGYGPACMEAARLSNVLVVCHPSPILPPLPVSIHPHEKVLMKNSNHESHNSVLPEERMENLISLSHLTKYRSALSNEGLNELRAMVALTTLSLLSQFLLLCGGAQVSKLLRPALAAFSPSSS